MKDQDQMEFDFDADGPEEQRVGTFQELLELDPKKIRAIKVGTLDQSSIDRILSSPVSLDLVPRWALEEFGEQAFLSTEIQGELGAAVRNHDSFSSPEASLNVGEKVITVWLPWSKGRHLSGLAVPFHSQQMDWLTYTMHLRSRLEELIREDPQEAKHWLTGSPEHSPDLYTIAVCNPWHDWADQIMMSDQMMITLNSIEWNKGVVETIPVDEMPSLPELIELL